MTLPADYDVLAPDGSEVRVLLSVPRGSMAHFRHPAGRVSQAVRHRSVEEIWYVVSGTGEMWRSDGQHDDVTSLAEGVCITIPAGTSFQFRTTGTEALAIVGVTMPPWPGEQEAEFVRPKW